MPKLKKRLNDGEAKLIGHQVKPKNNDGNAKYCITQTEWNIVCNSRSSTNDYRDTVMSAIDYKNKSIMDIDKYCAKYKLPREDVTSYKLVTHTGVPYYNIVFKEVAGIEAINYDDILSKYTKGIKPIKRKVKPIGSDFDMLTYSDVHIGMDTNKYGTAMYGVEWNKREVLKMCDLMIQKTLENKTSDYLIVDELGDLMDGLHGKTTRQGHDLPQNMTDEQAFDLALEFKTRLAEGLCANFKTVRFNNICNDNHAGVYGYFVNKSFKEICKGYEIHNYRQFMNHYYIGDVCFIITHGKEERALKFGFKPHLDYKQIDKIDHYCKQNEIYNKSKRIIFKKGDSHQSLFDMCGSDDFDYQNYPALSPSSEWVQTNFKKGRRGFVLESFKGLESKILPIFV